MRGWAHVDETAAASFTDTVAHPLPARRIVGFPGLRVVATIVAPRAMSADVQVTELLAIVARLHSAVDDLQSALDTRAAEHYGKLISAQINGIKAFAAAIA